VPVDVHRSASAQLTRHGARYTRQRRELVELLGESGQPLTVEQLHRLAPHLAQSSLYRNLTVLEEAGIVCRFTNHSDFSRYELAEALTGHHHHLVCSSCGAMTDVQLPLPVEDQLDEAVINLAKKQRFEPLSHTIDILGRCHDCTQRSRV
jgi:Fe2+ or Zn2+ uptake regulation protein